MFPSPHSGILFLWTSKKMMGNSKIQVSVPLFGDSFFICSAYTPYDYGTMFPSPYLGILFLWVGMKTQSSQVMEFPSPHSGILFLWTLSKPHRHLGTQGFRPLIRGFFFYQPGQEIIVRVKAVVSVPSFGDSFFILSL